MKKSTTWQNLKRKLSTKGTSRGYRDNFQLEEQEQQEAPVEDDTSLEDELTETVQTINSRKSRWRSFSRNAIKPNMIINNIESNSISKNKKKEPLRQSSTESGMSSIYPVLPTTLQVLNEVERGPTIPIKLGSYSGIPMSRTIIDESSRMTFEGSIARHRLLGQNQLLYHVWHVWKYGNDSAAKVHLVIDNENDLKPFLEELSNEDDYKYCLMRAASVPNLDLYKNGYLIRLKINKHKNQEDLTHFYSFVTEQILKNNIYVEGLKIGIFGITYWKRGQNRDLGLWVHPIMEGTFDIVRQAKRLVGSMTRYLCDDIFSKLTVIDSNTYSRKVIYNPWYKKRAWF
ncbi:uncharacterized protein J8A68_000051 [[Candida] subhashii]|uniref:Uncharacterized protein n=1 Tax=[Candida] subhashii TaxID=561895 RepID=A0A8J5QZS7_9ASCO|nr:uncharacterized protein J8A68_000051 [[Candida] subhashii]KAG7666420.1 hypothetical protein J8A68_000051 [[Candida] subhashii]